MMRPFGARAEKDRLEQRRQEIQQRLAAAGYRRGLDILGRRSSDAGDEQVAARLRETLQLLGPIFASFGRYLSSRPDLLTLSDCMALAEIPDRAAPTPANLIRQLVRAELEMEIAGVAPEGRFARFDPEPFESRLLSQLHYGELDNGDLVVVKLIHSHVRMNVDLQLLSLLEVAVGPRLADPDQFAPLLQDFRHAMADLLDCRRAAEAMEILAHDVRESDNLLAPKVYQDLCSQNILVTERVEGVRLDHYLAKCRARLEPLSAAACSVAGMVPDEVARQLCDVWLRQAFEGTMLPVDLHPVNVLVRSPTQFAIVDGTFVRLPRAVKVNLLNYLISNATDEPSKALSSLLKELDGSNRRISDSTLDRHFRQLVAFRDGGWDDGGRANCLSDTLFAQWRLAASHGYRPLRHLTQVYRGTFQIAALARQLAPHRDSLLEGVKDLRLTKLLQDISMMMQPSYWGGQADRIAALMMLGPTHLDGALKAALEQREEQAAPSAGNHARPSFWNSALLALLALTSFVAFRDHFQELLTPEWSERLSALVFLVTAGLMFRALASPVASERSNRRRTGPD